MRVRRWRAACFASPLMTTVLIDPSFRRARIVRLTVAALALLTVGTLVIFGRGLRARAHDPLALPSPRHALAMAGRGFVVKGYGKDMATENARD